MPDRFNNAKFDRTIFYISDGTGITAETFGHSVLSQFRSLKFRQLRLPFVDSQLKAQEAILKINAAAASDGVAPIVFSTLVDSEINSLVRESVNARYMDMFSAFIEPLENEFGIKSSHAVGLSHASANTEAYKDRIEAINFSLAHDDGQTNKGLEGSDVILIGVSRSGKTPTSLYLAMQYGLKAANYPLIPEDFERDQLPGSLSSHRNKLFGLTIAPERLSEIRNERRPNSRYAALDNCRYEVDAAEKMMRREGIRWLSSTTKSIEEIATTILQELKLERPGY